MIKILACTQELGSGASIPRVHCLATLKDVELRIKVTFGLTDLEWADIVFIHRPTSQELLSVARITKQLGKKLWIDNDDDQLSVEIDHKNYFHFNSPATKQAIIESNKIADVVTISNPEILKSYGELNDNIVYYPCAYPDKFFDEKPDKKRNKTVIWRGTFATKSLLEYKDSILEVAGKHPDWQFVFIGENPWFIIEKIKNPWYVYDQFQPPDQMLTIMKEYNPSILMSFHFDSQFSRSRSNMAYLDATIAGALVVAPDWKQWDCPSIRNYSSHEEFVFAMDGLMTRFDNGFDSSVEIAKARRWIKDHQTYSVINKVQQNIIKKLMGENYEHLRTATHDTAK